ADADLRSNAGVRSDARIGPDTGVRSDARVGPDAGLRSDAGVRADTRLRARRPVGAGVGFRADDRRATVGGDAGDEEGAVRVTLETRAGALGQCRAAAI